MYTKKCDNLVNEFKISYINGIRSINNAKKVFKHHDILGIE
ncbi:hypothetical protein GCM10010896_09760 [Mammaliicoccus stepanovicii]|uniref:Uncharacterized protein n=1 Tax=Mammaliicoccus stepanovicii TaxID=643214 RepID=A0A239YEW9_9STAP|nr:hypothetical protein GCM10010896_09760 [Mammaliicoccus stepanovicii]SNV57791.1 Uncharacterised protein [Mammaliicoccus stepanovicii]